MTDITPILPEKAFDRIKQLAERLHQYRIITSIFIFVDADEWLDDLEILLKKNNMQYKIIRSSESDDYIVINPHNFRTIFMREVLTNK